MKPAMISFMGLDGSGKSTSIDYAYEQLKKRGYKVEIVRAAYVIVFLRGIIKLGKKILMKKDSDPFSGDYKAYLESLRKNANKGGAYKIFSFLTTIEFKLQIFFKIRLKRFFGTTLLVDRYIYDNVVTYEIIEYLKPIKIEGEDKNLFEWIVRTNTFYHGQYLNKYPEIIYQMDERWGGEWELGKNVFEKGGLNESNNHNWTCSTYPGIKKTMVYN